MPVEQVRVISEGELSELVLSAEGVAAWPRAAAELPEPAPVGLVATAEQALFESERLVARWLLEHNELVRESSLRIARLAAEGKLLALRWLDVDWLAHRVRVRRNFVRGEYGTPKSNWSSRAVPLADRLGRDPDGLHRASAWPG